MHRRLIAAIACRNQGSRLYGKPLQNLDVLNSVSVIDNIIDCIRTLSCVDEIVLGISEGIDNEIYKTIAGHKNLKYVIGDQSDVLSRLIACAELVDASDVFRITSESPFLYYEEIESLWKFYNRHSYDAIFMDDVIDGCGFEIIRLAALKASHSNGVSRHRSEMCSLYIRENLSDFSIYKAPAPLELMRKDLRLTVDNPEDLVLCRKIYGVFRHLAPRIPVSRIVSYLDQNPELIKLVAPYTQSGYATMYL